MLFLELFYDKIGVELEVIDAQLHVDLLVLLAVAAPEIPELPEHGLALPLQLEFRLITYILEILVLRLFLLE